MRSQTALRSPAPPDPPSPSARPSACSASSSLCVLSYCPLAARSLPIPRLLLVHSSSTPRLLLVYSSSTPRLLHTASSLRLCGASTGQPVGRCPRPVDSRGRCNPRRSAGRRTRSNALSAPPRVRQSAGSLLSARFAPPPTSNLLHTASSPEASRSCLAPLPSAVSSHRPSSPPRPRSCLSVSSRVRRCLVRLSARCEAPPLNPAPPDRLPPPPPPRPRSTVPDITAGPKAPKMKQAEVCSYGY